MATDPTFWLSRDEVRELDRRAIEDYGLAGVVLMENAGRGAADLLMRLNPERKPVTILCGPGNNGGDGFVIARHLDNAGWPVHVWLFAPSTSDAGGCHPKLSPDCDVNDRIWAKGRTVPFVDQDTREGPPGWSKLLSDDVLTAGWVVDALFGSGLSRSLVAPYAEVVDIVNRSGVPILAVDIPSGLDCDTGDPLGPTIRATHTATFVAHKKGFANPTSREWTGEIHVIDIGAPRALVDDYRKKRETGNVQQRS
ncbi:NAD(P)H-hydrate epimerase [Fimbriiglobus ruber]|uniref:NAD(P)H-hydrate epimerase n=1 Tax=Fimbriiglobus ruber TaxID=1908690 RepID=A0A225DQI0_9BACT|nr:NAD(P)H-hydrate epimerase [Fimbriiglobus ruber]OWK40848.1 NAD(P)HX epimerase / NAD(P)HX dehydratase [Fimbriiglobus ruber]